MSDQDRISPYNTSTISGGQVMWIKKNINWGVMSWSSAKFSELALWEFHDRKYGELLMRS